MAMVGNGMQPLHAKLVSLQQHINELSAQLRPLRARVRRFDQHEDVEQGYAMHTRHMKQDSKRHYHHTRSRNSASRAKRRSCDVRKLSYTREHTDASRRKGSRQGHSSRNNTHDTNKRTVGAVANSDISYPSTVEVDAGDMARRNEEHYSRDYVHAQTTAQRSEFADAHDYSSPHDAESRRPHTGGDWCYHDADDTYRESRPSNNHYSTNDCNDVNCYHTDQGTREYRDTTCTDSTNVYTNDQHEAHSELPRDPMYTRTQTNCSAVSGKTSERATQTKAKCKSTAKKKAAAATASAASAAVVSSHHRAVKPRATEMTPLSPAELSAMRRQCTRLARLYRRRGALLRRVDVLLRRHARQQGKWESNEDRVACYRCQRPFSALIRRHHCRRCGRLCCAECSCYFGKKQDTTCYAHARIHPEEARRAREESRRTLRCQAKIKDKCDTRVGGGEIRRDGANKSRQGRVKKSSEKVAEDTHHVENTGSSTRGEENDDVMSVCHHTELHDTAYAGNAVRDTDDMSGERDRSNNQDHGRGENTSEEGAHTSRRGHGLNRSSNNKNQHSNGSSSSSSSSDNNSSGGSTIDGSSLCHVTLPSHARRLLTMPTTSPSRRRGGVVRTEYAMRMAAQDGARNDPERYYDDYTYPVSTLPTSHRKHTDNKRHTKKKRNTPIGHDMHRTILLLQQQQQSHCAGAQELPQSGHSGERTVGGAQCGRVAPPPDWVRLCAVCYQECLRARKTDVLKHMKSANRCILDDGFYYFYVLKADELHCAHTLLNKPDSLKKQVELQSLVLLERSVDYLAGMQRSGTRMLTRAAQQTPSILLSTLGSLSLSTAQFARRATGGYVGSYLAKHHNPPVSAQSTPGLCCYPAGHDLTQRLSPAGSSYSSLPECEPVNLSRGSFCSNSSTGSLARNIRNQSREMDEDTDSVINSGVD